MAAWRLTGTELRLLRGPVVYVLRQRSRVLYVGRSAQGLTRPLASTHHVLGRLAFDGSEELAVFPCASAAEAVAVEAELIVRMRPELNTRVVHLARPLAARQVGRVDMMSHDAPHPPAAPHAAGLDAGRTRPAARRDAPHRESLGNGRSGDPRPDAKAPRRAAAGDGREGRA